MSETSLTVTVTDNPAAHRYEAQVGGEVAGFAAYRLSSSDVIVFTHTEVNPAFGGTGIGSARAGRPGRRPGPRRARGGAALPLHRLMDRAAPGLRGPRAGR